MKKSDTQLEIGGLFEDQDAQHNHQIEPQVEHNPTDDSEMSRFMEHRLIFESSPDAIYVLNTDGCIEDVNLAACLLHEMGKADLIDKNFLELIHADFHQQAKADFAKWKSGDISFYESAVSTEDGDAVPVEIRFRVIKRYATSYLLIFARDISDRVKVGENFVESQRALSNFMSNLPGMAYRCLNDAHYTMKFVSHGCLALT
ncbi:MAG: PAS domain S-box protein, partial [bacterium]|nr:PAS domain S-box protein [bacterium]